MSRKLMFFFVLLIFCHTCKVVPIKILSNKDIAINTKYKVGNSSVQLSYNQIYILWFSFQPNKDWSVLTGELQNKENCAFLRNIEFDVKAQFLLLGGIKTTSITAECWIRE